MINRSNIIDSVSIYRIMSRWICPLYAGTYTCTIVEFVMDHNYIDKNDFQKHTLLKVDYTKTILISNHIDSYSGLLCMLNCSFKETGPKPQDSKHHHLSYWWFHHNFSVYVLCFLSMHILIWCLFYHENYCIISKSISIHIYYVDPLRLFITI